MGRAWMAGTPVRLRYLAVVVAIVAALSLLLTGLNVRPLTNEGPQVSSDIGIASAGTQGVCDLRDGSKVRLWENIIDDTQDGNDSLWLCGNDSDLTDNYHSLPGLCLATISKTNWNDCVSSYTIYVPSGQALCVYMNVGYVKGVFTERFVGPISTSRRDANIITDDHQSSLRWISSTANC